MDREKSNNTRHWTLLKVKKGSWDGLGQLARSISHEESATEAFFCVAQGAKENEGRDEQVKEHDLEKTEISSPL